MAYRMNSGNRYYKDGYLSNKYHGVCQRSGFQNYYSDNFNYGYNYNSSQQEDDEPSVKELLKSFIHTEAKMNEDLENQFEVWENQLMELNEKFDQNTISFDAWLQDTELKFDQMEERISNELTGQPIQNTQQNRSSWFCEEDYYSEDEDRISPKFYKSGLDAGRNEQQNPLHCSEVSICSTWDSQYPSASQSSHEESEGVVEYCLKNYPEAKIEEPKRAEKIIEMKAYTVEIEEEDSEDEESFNKLSELIMKNEAEEECVGDIDPEVLEFNLDKLETVSPMGEDGISPRFNKSGKTTVPEIKPQTNSEETENAPRNTEATRRTTAKKQDAPRKTEDMRRTFNAEENYAPHSSEVRRGYGSQGFSYGGPVELEIEDDDNLKQRENDEAAEEEPKTVLHPEIESEYEDSDDEDWFEELNELIVKENVEEDELESGLNELETVSPKKVEVRFNSDDELQESVEEVEGEGVEWLDIDVNKKSKNWGECENKTEDLDGMTKEEFGKWLDNELDGLETVSPIKVCVDFNFEEDMEFFEALDREPGRRMEEKLEVKNKPPELTEPKLQGMYNFIDKLVSLLSCRSDGIFGKVVANSHRRFHKKKCKNICIYFDYLRTLDIFVGTKEWNAAMVKFFEKVFVSNETCTFADDYFICLIVGEL